MSSIKRDTDQCVYIRFQVSEDRIDSFRKMFTNATKGDFMKSLKGLSKDSGNVNLTFAFLAPGSNDASKRSFTLALNAVFVKLFDFYPSISEKPSDLHTAAALSFIQQNFLPRPVSMVSELNIPVYN